MSEQSNSQIARRAAESASESAKSAQLCAERAYNFMLKTARSGNGSGNGNNFSLIKMDVLEGGNAGEYCYVGVKKRNGIYILSTFTKEEVEQ